MTPVSKRGTKPMAKAPSPTPDDSGAARSRLKTKEMRGLRPRRRRSSGSGGSDRRRFLISGVGDRVLGLRPRLRSEHSPDAEAGCTPSFQEIVRTPDRCFADAANERRAAGKSIFNESFQFSAVRERELQGVGYQKNIDGNVRVRHARWGACQDHQGMPAAF